MEVSMFTDDMEIMNDLSLIHHQLHLQVNSSFEELFVNNYDQIMTNEAQSYNSVQYDVHTLEEKPLLLKQLKPINNWNNPTYEINHVLKSQDDLNNSAMLSFSNNFSSCSNQTNIGLITPKKEVAMISNEMLVSPHQQQASPIDDKQCSNLARVVPKITSTNIGCTTQQSRDHIIAERKRREKLSQKLIALSAIIPGLKKMDKASVLGEAAKYVKQLQERVMKLEVEAKKKEIESPVVVKRCYVSSEEDDQVSGGSAFGDGPFPEIEAKIVEKDVLIKIHCEKKKGIVEKITSKIEELNLVVSSTSSLAFGGSTLAVTIVAQMDAEFSSITAKDVVRHMHASVKCFGTDRKQQ